MTTCTGSPVSMQAPNRKVPSDTRSSKSSRGRLSRHDLCLMAEMRVLHFPSPSHTYYLYLIASYRSARVCAIRYQYNRKRRDTH